MDFPEPSISKGRQRTCSRQKKDVTLRFCVDYQELNAMATRGACPIMRMDEYIDTLGYAAISTIHTYGKYWHVKIAEQDHTKAEFTGHPGSFCFNKMRFGFMNAPETFQRMMHIVQIKEKRQFVLDNLEEIVMFSKITDHHIEHARHVLTLLTQAGVMVNLKKCDLFTSHIDYPTSAIRLWGPPCVDMDDRPSVRLEHATILMSPRSFIGLCNVFWCFVRNVTRVTTSFNKKLGMGQSQTLNRLSDDKLIALETMKRKFEAERSPNYCRSDTCMRTIL